VKAARGGSRLFPDFFDERRHVVDLFDRNHMELGIVLLRDRERQRQRMEGVLRAVIGVQDFAEHASLPRSFYLPCDVCARRRAR
jgi:hypothetical protein